MTACHALQFFAIAPHHLKSVVKDFLTTEKIVSMNQTVIDTIFGSGYQIDIPTHLKKAAFGYTDIFVTTGKAFYRHKVRCDN